MGQVRQGYHPRKPDLGARLGEPPQAYRGGMWDEEQGLRINAGYRSDVTFHPRGSTAPGGRRGGNATPSNPLGFNLRGVVEVLVEFGLDPVAELGRVLTEQAPVRDKRTGETLMQSVPVLDKRGRPVIDRKTKLPKVQMVPVTEHTLDLDTRVRVLQDLTQYIHPKLKATEVTIKKPELSDDQVEARLTALMARALKSEAAK